MNLFDDRRFALVLVLALVPIEQADRLLVTASLRRATPYANETTERNGRSGTLGRSDEHSDDDKWEKSEDSRVKREKIKITTTTTTTTTKTKAWRTGRRSADGECWVSCNRCMLSALLWDGGDDIEPNIDARRKKASAPSHKNSDPSAEYTM